MCISFGSNAPFIFRKDEGYYVNIDECYVHGATHSEALECEGIEEVNFDLH